MALQWKLITSLLGTLVMLGASLPLNASFVGGNVSVEYDFIGGGTVYSSASQKVGYGGATFLIDDGAWSIVVNDSTVTFTSNVDWPIPPSSVFDDFFQIAVVDPTTYVEGATILSCSQVATNIPAYPISEVQPGCGSDSIVLDLIWWPTYQTVTAGSFVTMDAVFAPEPISLVLSSVGFLSIAVLVCYKRRIRY